MCEGNQIGARTIAVLMQNFLDDSQLFFCERLYSAVITGLDLGKGLTRAQRDSSVV